MKYCVFFFAIFYWYLVPQLRAQYDVYRIEEIEGWCYSDLDEYYGMTSNQAACWDGCNSKHDDLVAIDYYPSTNECYCQNACECIVEVDTSGFLLLSDKSEFPEYCDSKNGLSVYSLVARGWCSSALNQRLNGFYDTETACFEACENQYNTIIAAELYSSRTCWCQSDCRCMIQTTDLGSLIVEENFDFPRYCGDTESPTKEPSPRPSKRPSSNPTYYPTKFPTAHPTRDPTPSPPSYVPTRRPTKAPTETPTKTPTSKPTFKPTLKPSHQPTHTPTNKPTIFDTQASSSRPTPHPSNCPNLNPTSSLTPVPSGGPIPLPTFAPSSKAVTSPTSRPSSQPVASPNLPTVQIIPEATMQPTLPPPPTHQPTSSCEDSNNWFKNGDPSKDCEWVSSHFAQRCEVRGVDGSWAYEKCLATCGCDGTAPVYPTLTPTEVTVITVALVVDSNVDSEEVREGIFDTVESVQSIDQITIMARQPLTSRRRRILEEGTDAYDRIDVLITRAQSSFLDELKSAIATGALDHVVQREASLELLNNASALEPSSEPTVAANGSGGASSAGGSTSIIVFAIVIAVIVLICSPFFYWLYRRTTSVSFRKSTHIVNVIPSFDDDIQEDARTRRISKRREQMLSSKLESYQLRASRRVFDFEKNHVRWTSDTNEFAWLVRDLYSTSGEPCLKAANLGIDVRVTSSEEVRSALRETNPSRASFDQRIGALRKSLDSLRQDWTKGRVNISARRDSLAGDAYDQLSRLPAERWSQPFFISFVNEVALDAGGVSREFFRLLMDELLDVSYGLFHYGAGYTYQLADDTDSSVQFGGDDEIRDARYRFVGRVLGKVILEGHMIGTHPAMPLLKHIVSEPLNFDDLQALDYDYWKNLNDLTTLDADDIESLALTFSIAYEHFGEHVERELMPGGKEISVTGINVRQFIQLRFKDRVCDVHKRGLGALLRGVYDVVPCDLLMLMSARELELVLCGVPDINVDAWRTSCQYGGEFKEVKEKHPLVSFFWEIIVSWPNEKKAQLLQWCTGSASVPAQGFDFLQGRDGVVRKFQLTSISKDQAIYPRAHTCFNRIDIPLYDTKSELEDALDFVILTNSDDAYGGFSMD